MESNKILAIIPARGGSKSIPGKNLAVLDGKPLIQYTIDAAKNSKLIGRLIISSDSHEIIDYGRKNGIEAPFIRPDNLSCDDTPMIDVVHHAVEFMRDKNKYIPSYILLLQPTSPLRNPGSIDSVLESLIESGADSVVSVIQVPHNFNPYSVMRLEGQYLDSFLDFDEKNNIRQKKPEFFARNGPAVLAFSYECLMEKHSMYGSKVLAYSMNREESIDIDDEFDLRIAECIIRNKDNKR